MFRKSTASVLTMSLLASSFIAVPVTRSEADRLGEILVPTIILCATGVICKQKPKPPVHGTSSVDSTQRAENRQVQNALNDLGFPVGSADGALGRRSQDGIRDYQRYLGYTPTGQLTELEKQLLLDTHRQFQAGLAPQYADAIQRDGIRGMIKAVRGDYQVAIGSQPPLPPTPPSSTETTPIKEPGPIIQPPPKPTEEASASMAQRCDLVDMVAATGGAVDGGRIVDADMALSQQFCGLRGEVLSQGEIEAGRYPDWTPTKWQDNVCDPVANALSESIDRVPSVDPATLVPEVTATLQRSGLKAPADNAVYGKVCMGLGYRTDNPRLAIAGALMMLSTGDTGYSEALAHHLREGFGVPSDRDAAARYYQAAMDAQKQGMPSAIGQQSGERLAIIHQAMAQGGLQGRTGEGMVVVPVTAEPVLPLLAKP